MHGRDAIAELIPHQDAMCLLDRVVEWGHDHIVLATATHRRHDNPLRLNGRLRAIHLNDSKKPLGSRVDRHEHIGEGCLGDEPFRHLLNDPRLAGLPMYLETPKGKRDGRDLDAVNLERLRGLIAPVASAAKPRRRKSR